MLTPRVLVVGSLLLVVLIVVAQNTEVVAVRFLFWEVSMSQVVLILLATLVGFAGGYLLASMKGRASKKDRQVTRDPHLPPM